jgi:hypothetical protein
MIRGLDIFRERFRTYEGSLVLIGGAACDDGFSRQELTFRATKDLDIILLLEAVDHKFVATMRQFIHDGGYQIRQRSESDSPVLYRLAKPTNKNFPHMLEIFSQAPETAALKAGRLMLEEIQECVNHGQSFAFETTLSGLAYLKRIRSWQESGYHVSLFFLSLPHVDIAIERVAERVKQGGTTFPLT